jgi:hypothetical protein
MIHALPHFVFRHARAPCRERGVVEHIEPRKARVFLKHDRHAVRHLASHEFPFELDRAAARGIEAREHV